MQIFRKKRPSLLGIDISTTAVKLLEFSEQRGGGLQVESYAVEPLPANAVVEKNVVEVDAVSDSINAAYQKSGSRTKGVALAVPSSAAISKVINLAADLNDEEMEAQIRAQADQYVPYPLDEVNLDFQRLGPAPGRSDEVQVLLVACRSDNIESRVDALDAAGLTAEVMDVESYAVENAFHLMSRALPDNGDGKTVAVVDIGATMTALTVMADDRIVYTREQLFGGRQLTEEIMRRYDMTFEQAGKAKRLGGLPDTYEQEVLEPFKEAMAQQVSRALQFFFGSGQTSTVDYVLFAGGCATIPGAAQVVAEHTGTPTVVANPFTGMTVNRRINPKVLAADAPAMMIASGLAMRSFDQ